MDAWLFLKLNALGSPLFDELMWLASELGKGEFAAAITIILVGIARKGLRLWPSVMIVLAISAAGTTSSLIKDWVYRPRPYTTLQDDVRVVGEELRQRSFPSGHTTSAFALLVAACLPLRRKGPWLVGIPLAVLVALSRIYVGAHYPGDVIAGAMVGIFWGVVASRALGMVESRQR